MTHVVGRGFHTFWNPNPSKSFTLAVANSVTPKARIGIGKGSITKLSRAQAFPADLAGGRRHPFGGPFRQQLSIAFSR